MAESERTWSLWTSERPFRDAGFFQESLPENSGVVRASRQKRVEGATEGNRAYLKATLEPSMPVGEHAVMEDALGLRGDEGRDKLR